MSQQATLFGTSVEQTIRSLGFYQPFGSLMLHGKIETRWVTVGKQPPFPKGKYLFYTTKKCCARFMLFNWCGPEIMYSIDTTLQNEPTKELNGYAIAIGELIKVRRMTKEDEAAAFVLFEGVKEFDKLEGGTTDKQQWCLEFANVQRIKPFGMNGKQGVGILTPTEINQINFI